MRTTTLTTASLLGLAMLVPIPVANAAGETCRGEAATIVGAPSNPALLGSDGLTGTEGRDVVVTNGATNVSTLGGDDVICVTTNSASSVERVTIDAGVGDDIVDGTTAPDWVVQAELGLGTDRFEGGNAGNSVGGAYRDAAPADTEKADTEKDVIIGGDGPDGVQSGAVGHPNPDVIALGAGDDSIFYGGFTAGGSIDGGAGVDEFFPSALRTSGDTVIDNAAEHLLINQQIVATWSSLETFWTGTRGGDELVFVGTAADETVYAKVSGRVRATFGAGDDSLRADQAPRAGSVIDGGDGRDLVYVTSEAGLLDLDLRRGKLVADAGSPYTTSATNFEDASLFARRVILSGTDGRNDISFSACDATLRGRGGADTIARYYESLFESVFCPRFPKAHLNGGSGRDDLAGTLGRDVLLGGRGKDFLDGGKGADRLIGGSGPDELRGAEGNDVLRGGRGNDRVDGGRARDHADGGPGRKDLCRAEHERRCER